MRRLGCGADRPGRDARRARRCSPSAAGSTRSACSARSSRDLGAGRRPAVRSAPAHAHAPAHAAAGDPGRRARRRSVAPGDRACRHGLGARPRRRGSGVLARAGSDRRCDRAAPCRRERWKRCAGAVSARRRPGRRPARSSPPPSPQPQPQPRRGRRRVDRIVNTVTPVTRQLPAPVGPGRHAGCAGGRQRRRRRAAARRGIRRAAGIAACGSQASMRRSLLALSALRGAARPRCGGGHDRERRPDGGPHAGRRSPRPRSPPAADWLRFDFDAQRSGVGPAPPASPRTTSARCGCAGSTSPGPSTPRRSSCTGSSWAVRGATCWSMTTTYGRTLALDPRTRRGSCGSSRRRDIGSYEGSAQITTATPIADPDRRFVYASSPDGRIHKLAVASGREVRSGGWPVSVTFDATHEKIASALNISGSSLVVVTGGYIGDAPPYQGHVVMIDRSTGRITAVWNSLCSDRHAADRAAGPARPATRRSGVATGRWSSPAPAGSSSPPATPRSTGRPTGATACSS